MPSGVEVAKVAIDDFKEIQEYMILAKKENAILNVCGVNLTDIDEIKE